jgi:hypothetical protein
MMKKVYAALVAGAFAMVPMTSVLAQDKAPAKAPDCKAAATKVAECKKAMSTTAECKAADATMAMDACKTAAAAAAPAKKEKKGGC